MEQIEFRRTANAFLNTGILALYKYLIDCIKDNDFPYPLCEDQVTLTSDALRIERCPDLIPILSYIYYKILAKDVYDTSTKEALEKKTNAYYIAAEDRFELFPKMNTYGIAALITNNAAGKTRIQENTITIKNIKKSKPDEAAEIIQKFENFFEQNGIKLQEQLYFDEAYTKITRLDFDDPAYFQSGKQTCYLTGVSRKKLISITSTSVFISGMNNFNSFRKPKVRDICWEAAFLSRFAPKLSFYAYVKGLKSLTGFVIASNNLLNLKKVHRIISSVFNSVDESRALKFMSNFKLHDFGTTKEGLDHSKDYTGRSELAFMLFFTIYKKFFEEADFVQAVKSTPFSLIAFQADSFAATMRPNGFEHFDNFLFMMQLFYQMEKEQISVRSLLIALKFKRAADQGKEDKYRLERSQRSHILDKILKKQTILADIESIFYDTYLYLTSEDRKQLVGSKNYVNLLNFTQFYESKINQNMDENIKERAIKLGTSIGQSILRDGDGEKSVKDNAKRGRGYIIQLHKARTSEQFREAIIRLQQRYQLVMSGELLTGLTEENFVFVKQFAIISALNQINSSLKPKKNEAKSE